MKKKLLFINPSMCFGGAEKSLVTLLSLIDYSKYEVSLFLFRHEGEFLKLLPEEVNILPLPESYVRFTAALGASVKELVKHGEVSLSLYRILYSRTLRSGKPIRSAEQDAWKYLSRALPMLNGEYDAAVAYLEGSPAYFCIDKVKADKKILYIHNDYGKLGMDAAFDAKYFSDADAVVTVSEECAASLREIFPQSADKVKVIYNITSANAVRAQARQQDNIIGGFDDGFDGLRLLTIGRLNEQKGIDIAVEAFSRLRAKGIDNIRWYVLGGGDLRADIERLIRERGVGDGFVLLGETLNPYPYIDRCDIYVQPSRFEGKSIALEEVKCLGKPIVTTRFTTVADQIEDGVTGIIAEISPDGVAEGIERLVNSPELRDKLSAALANYTSNEDELEKFCCMIG